MSEHEHEYEEYWEDAYGIVTRCECGRLDPERYSAEERGEDE